MQSQFPSPIPPVLGGGNPRPFWSVMIPAYDPSADYLAQTLRSVLAQDPGPERMQIEVVDDCSPKVNVAALVREIAGDRVKVSQTPQNLGLAGCWNTCLERARGAWVHILHQDDFVLPGFYKALEKAAERHPHVNLLATRSFFVDENGVISEITERIKEMETGGRAVNRFFYHTPIQCPGVAVKRAFYESNGGFLQSLVSGLDCEMWARAVGLGGGVVLPEALACYRSHPGNESGRLARNARILSDTMELNRVFEGRYPEFDAEKGRQKILKMALELTWHFTSQGDAAAAEKCLNFWKANAPLPARIRRSMRRLAGKFARKIFLVRS